MNRINVALAVSILALICSSPIGAHAASLITGKQIKDGTIQKRDLAPALRSAFEQGEIFEVRGDGRATCPNGSSLIVGGALNAAGDQLQQSYPDWRNNAWVATNAVGRPGAVAMAVCVR